MLYYDPVSSPHTRKLLETGTQVVDLQYDRGTASLWIATNGQGVYRYRQDRVDLHLTTEQGLPSNICNQLVIQDTLIWLATDRGLVRLSQQGALREVYTHQDGLEEDHILTMAADGDQLWVATPSGVNRLDVSRLLKPNPPIPLHIHRITVNDSLWIFTGPADRELDHTQNRIRIDFQGITFNRSSRLRYAWRWAGEDSSWRFTDAPFLEFSALRPGEYALELSACTAFSGPREETIKRLTFTIHPPWWQQTWFYVLLGLTLVGGTLGTYRWRVGVLERRAREENEAQKRTLNLQMRALRSQLNAHFIYNTLNTIQGYIIDAQTYEALEFVEQLGRLIRLTLRQSGQNLIPLAEEIEYLKLYLRLESVRFGNLFTWSLEIDPALTDRLEALYVPTMFLQIYTENAIRNGLVPKQHLLGAAYTGGQLHLRFSTSGSGIQVEVEDTGVGYEESLKMKQSQVQAAPGERPHQSMGLKINQERRALLNRNLQEPIETQIMTLRDADGQALGTRVTIYLPSMHPDTHAEVF